MFKVRSAKREQREGPRCMGILRRPYSHEKAALEAHNGQVALD